ncbi:MAG: hypothetical protein ACOYEJ_06895 [Mahellales bacterium]|jgi:urease beta subunit
MRKGLILVVVLLCVASLMAAMAYTTAEVNNPATMSIVNSNEALLRMYPWSGRTGTKDATCFIGDDGVMHFNFGAGYGDAKGQASYGFQPDSVYKWGQLFRVYNMSNDKVQFTIENDGLKYITVATHGYVDATSNAFVFVRDGNNTGTRINIPPNSHHAIAVKFVVPYGVDLEDLSGKLIVKSWAVD